MTDEMTAVEVADGVVNLIVSQFTSDVAYTGAEVIGRIRSIAHIAYEAHDDEGPCPICDGDDDPGEGDDVALDVLWMTFEAGARAFVSGLGDESMRRHAIEAAWSEFRKDAGL